MKKLLDSLSPASEVLKVIVYTITLLFFLAILCLILLFGLGRLVSQLYPQSPETAVVMQPNTVVPYRVNLNTSSMYQEGLPWVISYQSPESIIIKRPEGPFIMKMDILSPSHATIGENSKSKVLSLSPMKISLINLFENSKNIIGKDLVNLMLDRPIEKNSKNCIQKKFLPVKKYDHGLHWCIAPLLAAGIIGGAASLGSSIIGGVSGASAQNKANETNLQIARETNQANAALAQQQQNWNVDLWNMQNEYNTPAAQMQRYQGAGLNPNLIYGSGSGSSGNAASVSTVSPARMERAHVQPVNYFQGVAQGLSQGLSAFLQSQQLAIAEKRADADVARTGSSVDLNLKKAALIEAQTYSEQLRPELIAQQINNLNQKTAHEFVLTALSLDRQMHSSEYYRQQVEAQALAMKLTEMQISRIVQSMQVELERLNLSKSEVSAGIEYLKQGGTLRELQAEYMRAGLPYIDAEKITGIIGGVLGAMAKGASIK